MNLVYDKIQGLVAPKPAFLLCISVIVDGAIISLQARNLEIILAMSVFHPQ